MTTPHDAPTLFGIDLSLDALVSDAIKLLRTCEPKDRPYHLCQSGGKDSACIEALAKMSGVRYESHHNLTTIDPPELIWHLRRNYPDTRINKPPMGFFRFAIEHKYGFPTRRARWCCKVFKESRSPKGCLMILGVRAAESARRAKNWAPLTFHNRTGGYVVSPILRWSDEHVWEFIRRERLPYCCLYDEGFTRLGCIGCPMARKAGRLREFARWPWYANKWRMLFRDVWTMRTGSTQRNGAVWFGDRYFETWQEMFEWWLSDEPLPTDKHDCQGLLEFFS